MAGAERVGERWERRSESRGRGPIMQGPARTGKAPEFYSTMGSSGGCQGVHMLRGGWGRREGGLR